MFRRIFIKTLMAMALLPLMPKIPRADGSSFVTKRGYIDAIKSHQSYIKNRVPSEPIALPECPRPFNYAIIATYRKEDTK